MTDLTILTTKAAPALLTLEQVERIEERLTGLTDTVYLAANLAAIARDARKDDDIELGTVLGHMCELLMKVAGALDVGQIIPYAERTKGGTAQA